MTSRIVDGKLVRRSHGSVGSRTRRDQVSAYPDVASSCLWIFVPPPRKSASRQRPGQRRRRDRVLAVVPCPNVCPAGYDLLFERFLDESRTSRRISISDFEKERRIESHRLSWIRTIRHELGGADRTFGTLAAQSAIRHRDGPSSFLVTRPQRKIPRWFPMKLKITIKKALDK